MITLHLILVYTKPPSPTPSSPPPPHSLPDHTKKPDQFWLTQSYHTTTKMASWGGGKMDDHSCLGYSFCITVFEIRKEVAVIHAKLCCIIF